MASLPREIEVEYDKIRLYFTHASPFSIDEYLYKYSSILSERLETLDAEVLVIGHTHISYINEISGKKIINVGSVGRSKEKDNKASYGILEIVNNEFSCEIIKINYQVKRTVEAILKSDIPDFYADFFQI